MRSGTSRQCGVGEASTVGVPEHMLRQVQHEIVISTRGRGFYEFTEQVSDLLTQSSIQTGQVTLHVQHTSASLVIQENADPEVRRDFERFFKRLVPDGDALFEQDRKSVV